MKKRKILVILLSVLIACTLGFIWGNSFMGKESSSTESETMYKGFFSIIFDFIFGEGVISHEIFRKMAHAGEFFILGVEINALYIVIERFSLKRIFEICFFGLTAGVIDECIQIISNRGPMVTDVLIDFSGYLLSAVIFLCVYYIVKKKKIKKQ